MYVPSATFPHKQLINFMGVLFKENRGVRMWLLFINSMHKHAHLTAAFYVSMYCLSFIIDMSCFFRFNLYVAVFCLLN